jgi:exopolysaccharide production protein ExoQ
MSIAFFIPALIIIAVFFRQDSKETSLFSWNHWAILIWLLASTTRLLQIVFSGGMPNLSIDYVISSYGGGNPLIRYVSLVLILIGLFLFIKKRDRIGLVLRNDHWLIIIHLYAFLSIAWAADPGTSLRKYIRLLGLPIFAGILIGEKDHKEALEHILRKYFSFCLIMSVYLLRFGGALAYVRGRMGTRYMAGISWHKNELAILCAFSLVFFLWRILKSKSAVNYFDIALILINIYLLIKARSAMGSVAAALGVGLLISLEIIKKNPIKAFIIATIIMVLVIPSFIIFQGFHNTNLSDSFYNLVGKEASLTGRVPMWIDFFRLGKKDIVMGAGYESFWIENMATIWSLYQFGPTNSHNGYIEVTLNLGLVGLTLLTIYLVKIGVALMKKANIEDHTGRLLSVFFVIFILGNITEVSIMIPSLNWWLLVVIALSTVKDRLSITQQPQLL